MGIFNRRIKAKQIRSRDELEEAVATGKPVFVDFMKNDCQPCRTMDGIVNELADEFQDEAIVLKVNVSQVPELFDKFRVKATPTFIVLAAQGEGVHQRFRHSGLVKKDRLVEQLELAVASN